MKWILIVVVAVVIALVFYMKTSVDKSDLDNKLPQETQTKAATKTTSINDQQPQQPEKSLPLPAQQLQKMLSEEKKNESLDERISAANQDIAEIDRQLAQAGYKIEDNATPSEPDAKSAKLNERIQHINDHVNQ